MMSSMRALVFLPVVASQRSAYMPHCAKGQGLFDQNERVASLPHFQTCMSMIPEGPEKGSEAWNDMVRVSRYIDTIMLNDYLLDDGLDKYQLEANTREPLGASEEFVPQDVKLQQKLAKVLLTPVLSLDECEWIVGLAEASGQFQERMNWNTSDLDLKKLHAVVAWMKQPDGVRQRIIELVRSQFGLDSTVPIEICESNVVRYDSQSEMVSYSVHADGPDRVTYNMLLSDPKDFEGGGTWLPHLERTVFPQRGSMLTYADPVYHGGAPVTSGRRYIWQGFMEVPKAAIPHAEETSIELLTKVLSVQEALTFHPACVDTANMYAHLAALLRDSKRLQEALEAYRAAQQVDLTHSVKTLPNLLVQEALVLKKLGGRDAEAKGLVKKAYALDPADHFVANIYEQAFPSGKGKGKVEGKGGGTARARSEL